MSLPWSRGVHCGDTTDVEKITSVHMCIRVYTHTHTHTHTHTGTRTHTYTHTYTHMHTAPPPTTQGRTNQHPAPPHKSTQALDSPSSRVMACAFPLPNSRERPTRSLARWRDSARASGRRARALLWRGWRSRLQMQWLASFCLFCKKLWRWLQTYTLT